MAPDSGVADAASDDGMSAAGCGDGASHAAAEATVRVVVRSSDPVGLRARLGVPAAIDGDRLVLWVDTGRSDDLLLAALRWGGSVESVGPG